MAYDVGDVVRVTSTWKVAGVATDPTAVSFRVRNPAGTITTYTYPGSAETAKVATGVFRVDVSLNQAGTWYVRSIGTGAAEGVHELDLYVQPGQAA